MISQETRDKGIEVLENILTNKKNVTLFEKQIYVQAIKNTEEDPDSIYIEYLYEISSQLKQNPKIIPIFENLKKGKIGWNNSNFDTIRKKQQDKDEFLVNPFEIEEGVQECNKCGSKRTFSYQKQTRSADEGMTTFLQCVCGHKWRYSG
jgi:DNA-directed RNA polymerase subunit M/transcription elongation factor TFIIS